MTTGHNLYTRDQHQRKSVRDERDYADETLENALSEAYLFNNGWASIG
jgi:hypothetical protein